MCFQYLIILSIVWKVMKWIFKPKLMIETYSNSCYPLIETINILMFAMIRQNIPNGYYRQLLPLFDYHWNWIIDKTNPSFHQNSIALVSSDLSPALISSANYENICLFSWHLGIIGTNYCLQLSIESTKQITDSYNMTKIN